MYSNEHNLQELLKMAYRRLDMQDTVDEIEVKEAYKRVVGDLIFRLTWNVQYKEGVLRVRLASAALRQELFCRRESLKQTLNENIGHDVVKKIEFY